MDMTNGVVDILDIELREKRGNWLVEDRKVKQDARVKAIREKHRKAYHEKRKVAQDAGFDPNEPRDAKGRWVEYASKGFTKPPEKPKKTEYDKLIEAQKKAILEIAKAANFPEDKLTIVERGSQVFYNIQQTERVPPSVEGFTKSGGGVEPTITIFVNPDSTPDHIAGVMLHELQHVKFDTVLNAAAKQHNEWVAAGRNDADMDKYPLAALLNSYMSMGGAQRLSDEDGCSMYSNDVWGMFWTNSIFEFDRDIFIRAVHETLAEIARVKHEFIDRDKEEDWSWRHPTSYWMDFYNDVNKAYDDIQSGKTKT
jgi:hypothetical protein